MNYSRILIWLFFMAQIACAAKSPDITIVMTPDQICQEPRPQVCTLEYRVVCATLIDGSNKEYSNGCTACSDSNAISWIDGNCPE